MTFRSRPIAAVVLVCGVAVAFGARSLAQQTPPADMTTALLNEVHALRLAIERSNAVAPRVQLTLARLNIEEQRVAQLSTQLDRVRQELNSSTVGFQRMSEAMVELEKRLQVEVDDKVRKQLETERVAMNSMLKMHGASIEQLRLRENDAAQALSTEQSRWIDLNAKLDELERFLGPIR